MADNIINTTLRLNTEGLKEAVSDSSQINANLKAAAQNSIRTPLSLSAAQQGMASANGVNSQAAASSNLGRGITGNTGAAGRDFAAQSQGLGGLVHVYATFAANIYAASAAFGALKEAMNTLHLQQGIEQLSAQSGKNLTSLAAQLNMVTDGALSMKASLTSVANASAVGMTNKQILQMGEVAKKASQAMGWDMADAMDRLTKGIGKNRPQLLDELGIIVSANQIYQDYARQVGKTSLTLTDYEKKQAFANAVLQQGIDKFGAIDIPTNPFNKLEASAYNALQSILGLIDKGLGPVAKYLAESPTGLAIAMAGIASVLLKQAIPAIGAFRENASKMAAESHARIKAQVEDQRDAAVLSDKYVMERAELVYQSEKSTAKKVAELQRTRVSSVLVGADVKTIMKKSPWDISDAEISKIKAKHTELENSVLNDAGLKQAAGLSLYLSRYNKLQQDLAKVAEDAQIANQQRDEAGLTHAYLKEKILSDLTKKAARADVLANVANNAATFGPSFAFQRMKKDIDALDDSKFNKFITGVKGGFSIATSAVSTFLSAFSVWGQVIGIVLVGLTALDAVFSKATEQQDAFNGKIVEGTSATKTAADALDYLGKKSKDVLGIVAITAMTNAMDGLTSSIEGQIDTLKKWNTTAGRGGWDKAKDFLAGLFNKSNADVFAKSMGNEIQGAIDTLIFTPKLQKDTQDKIIELFKIDSDTIKNYGDLAKAISEKIASPGGFELAKQAEKILLKAKEADAASTDAAKSFLDAMKAVDTEIDIITNKLQFKDGIGKLGTAVEDMAHRMTLSMNNPLKSLEGMLKLASDPKMLAMLGPEAATKLIGNLQEIKNINSTAASAQKEMAAAEAEIKALTDAKKVYSITGNGFSGDMGGFSDIAKQQFTPEYKQAQDNLALATANQASVAGSVKIFTDKIVPGLTENLLNTSSILITTAVKDAKEKAALSVAMANLSSAQKAGLITVSEELAIRLREVDLREKEVVQAFEYTSAVEENTKALEAATAQAIIDSSSPDVSKEAKTRAISTQDILTLGKVLLESPGAANTGRFADTNDRNAQLAKQQSSKEANNRLRLEALRAPFGAERTNLQSAAALDIQHKRNALQQEWLKTQNLIVAQDLQTLSLQEKYSAGYVEELSSRRVSLEVTQAENTYRIDSLAITNKEIDLYNKRKNYTLEGFAQKVAELEIEKELASQKRTTSEITSKMVAFSTKLTSDLAIQKSYQDTIIANAQNNLTITTLARDIETTKLTQMKEQSSISDTLYNSKMEQLALAKVQDDYNVKSLENTIAQQQAQDDYNKKLKEAQELARKTAEANAVDMLPSEVTAVGNQAASGASVSKEAQAAYDSTKAKLLGINAVNKANLDSQKQQIDLQYTYIDLLKQQADVQKGLVTLFGDMGGKLFTVVKAFSSLQKKSAGDDAAVKAQKEKVAYNEKSYALAKDVWMTESEINSAREDDAKTLGKLEQDNTVNKIEGIGAIAGATKDMFEKGSKQAKLMAEVEKASALITTGAAIAKLVAQSGWFGFAGAAVLVAMLASYGIGSGSTGMPSGGFDAASQQKVQGTGQSYDAAGNIVNNGGGVMGDSTAKAKSVDDSISNLEKYSFKTLEFSNKMLEALKSIKTNTDGLTTAILRAGINVASTNIDGSIKVGKSATAFSGSAWDPASLAIGKNNLPGAKVLQKISSSIFGGSSNTTIEDTGIQISGMITAIAKSANGLAQQYTKIKTVTSGGWFRSDKTNLSQQVDNLGSSMNTALEGIFTGIIDTVSAAGSALGKDPSSTKALIDGFNVVFRVSAQGLDAKGLADLINAQIGVTFNQLATLVFPELTQFRTAGEEMGTTIVRLARDTQVLGLALDSIGMSFKTTGTLVEKVGITESLIKLSGGLDTFVSQADFFKSNFLTTSEQLAPVQAALTKELDRMGSQFHVTGLSAMNTREQFAKTVRALDLTTESGQQEYVALMNVADAFSQVYPETRNVVSAIDLLKSKLQQQIEIYNLEGKSTLALTLQRQNELEQMDERLRAGQLYIYALQDEATLKGDLKTAYDAESSAIKSTISTLKSSIKTLNDYKVSLNLGTQSNLTPEQKYQVAKDQAMQVASIATGIINTTNSAAQQAIDQQAKTDAISQLPSVSAAFLDASRNIFASSSMYNQDYSYIQDLLTSTSSALSSQQTDAQKQLDVLDQQVGALISITTNTATTNEILSRLEQTQLNINASQPGAAASGLIVGSLTTSTPNIETLFSQLTQKVADLMAEVSGLRADQQSQTQDIIVANATTQAVAADTIATVVGDTVSRASWNYDQSPEYQP